MEWYVGVLKKYAVFDGRARRKEYWMFYLFNMIVSFGLGVVDGIIQGATDSELSVLGTIYSLAILVPSIAVGIRRLHDTGRSGWWLLVPIANLVFLILPGDAGPNKYGPDPKGGDLGYAPAAAPAMAGSVPGPAIPSSSYGSAPVSDMTPADSAPAASASAPAAWLADPTGRHELRYWDGQQWTENVSDAGATSTDPV